MLHVGIFAADGAVFQQQLKNILCKERFFIVIQELCSGLVSGGPTHLWNK
jgi:hypothetical protein